MTKCYDIEAPEADFPCIEWDATRSVWITPDGHTFHLIADAAERLAEILEGSL